MPQCFRVDGDIFEKTPRVYAKLFNKDKKGVFSTQSGYTCGRGLRTENLKFNEIRRIFLTLEAIL